MAHHHPSFAAIFLERYKGLPNPEEQNTTTRQHDGYGDIASVPGVVNKNLQGPTSKSAIKRATYH